jgi:pilus assembly protein FimV
MKRIAIPVVAAAIALQASLAQALGIGDITLKSGLNEPLRAEIRVRGAGDLSADQVIVELANSADFQRAGVERLYSLAEIDFEVELSSKGDGVIRLSTPRPVREPYLDFVVEVRWPTGRVLREYTVLLDLPTTTPTPAPAVRPPSAPRTGSTARQRRRYLDRWRLLRRTERRDPVGHRQPHAPCGRVGAADDGGAAA